LRRFQVNLQFLAYWDVLSDEDAKLLQTREIPGHAEEFETAFALAAFPENVRSAAINNSAASKATAALGKSLIPRIVDRVAQRVQEMVDGTSVAPVPPFFP
jgi:creatinine amidohydrolase/Fe(II)-dependent formamide hydrolase-like protein